VTLAAISRPRRATDTGVPGSRSRSEAETDTAFEDWRVITRGECPHVHTLGHDLSSVTKGLAASTMSPVTACRTSITFAHDRRATAERLLSSEDQPNRASSVVEVNVSS